MPIVWRQASNDAFWKFIAKTYETQSDITAENADRKADCAGGWRGSEGRGHCSLRHDAGDQGSGGCFDGAG